MPITKDEAQIMIAKIRLGGEVLTACECQFGEDRPPGHDSIVFLEGESIIRIEDPYKRNGLGRQWELLNKKLENIRAGENPWESGVEYSFCDERSILLSFLEEII